VGYSIALRDRNQYTVTTGATLVVQDTTEASQTLTINTQKHIGMNFTSADLTMVIDEFSRPLHQACRCRTGGKRRSRRADLDAKKVANFVDSDATRFRTWMSPSRSRSWMSS
jgi:hypothetical protein